MAPVCFYINNSMKTFNDFLFEEYSAYVLDEHSRNLLKKRFPPKYPEFIGHHITYKFGVAKDTVPPSDPSSVNVIGYADEDGLEALVVSIDNSSERPDGSIYHITWSLDRSEGKKPVHSNKLVKRGFKKIHPIKISVTPKILK